MRVFRSGRVCVRGERALCIGSERPGEFWSPGRGRASARSAAPHLSSSKGQTRREAGAQSHGPSASPQTQRPKVAWLPKGMGGESLSIPGAVVGSHRRTPSPSRDSGHTDAADAHPAISTHIARSQWFAPHRRHPKICRRHELPHHSSASRIVRKRAIDFSSPFPGRPLQKNLPQTRRTVRVSRAGVRLFDRALAASSAVRPGGHEYPLRLEPRPRLGRPLRG